MDEYNSYFLYILACVSCVQLEQLCARCVSDVQEEERGGRGERPHLTPLQTSEQRKLRQEKEVTTMKSLVVFLLCLVLLTICTGRRLGQGQQETLRLSYTMAVSLGWSIYFSQFGPIRAEDIVVLFSG